MSAVVKAVTGVVKGAVDIVESAVETVGDVVEDVVDVVEDAGSWIDDNILQPLKEDPITTIATIAAVATGNPQLVPYINAGSTAAKGGDIGDIALSFGASYVGNQAGSYVGKQVSQTLSTVVVDAAGNVVYQPAINIAADTAAGATRGAVTAGIQGQDIATGATTGAITGFAGGAGKETGQLVFDETGSKVAADITRGVTTGATSAALSDKDIGVGAIMGGANAALNTAVNFGSEYLFGEKKTQTDWEKAVTQTLGSQFVKSGMQEVYQEIADQPTGTTTKVASTSPTSQTETGFTFQREGFELRRYVNDEGDVIYVTFRGDEPQQSIPPGYKEDKGGTPVPQTKETRIAQGLQPAQRGTMTPTGVTPLPQVAVQTPVATTQMNAAKGGLATKIKKEKKPTSSKGLAAKKK